MFVPRELAESVQLEFFSSVEISSLFTGGKGKKSIFRTTHICLDTLPEW